MSKIIDMTGKRFHRVTVLEQYDINQHQKVTWECLCDCGAVFVCVGSSLRNGSTKSCGCYQRENTRKIHKTHGMCQSSEYIIWQNMKDRCHNPNNKSYDQYGMRGITVCDEWLSGFEGFYRDMGDRPSSKHSIDRIDNDGNYELGNCQWATSTEQARNKRLNPRNKSGAHGVFELKKGEIWTAAITVNYKQIYLGQFDSFDKAAKARKAAEMKFY